MSSLILLILILIIVDVFLSIEIPTHIAYVLLTFIISYSINNNLLFKILSGVLIWFALIVFHYTIWRKLIEKIHDKIVAPRKHLGGIEALKGQKGIIREVEGTLFISIREELYEFECRSTQKIILDNEYKIIDIVSNKVII